MIAAIVVLVLLALASLGAVLYHRRGGPGARAHRAHGRELARTLKTATKTHSSAIAVAERDVRTVQSAYDKGVRGAERELRALRDPDGRRLGAYRGITLSELAINTPQGKSSLIGATATVTTAGNLAVSRRATLTRTVAGGALLGPVGAVIGAGGFKKEKRVDTRELYLLVETPTLAAVVQCPPDQGMRARQFAAQINTAAKQAEALAAARPGQIADAERNLDAARSATAALDAAQSRLATVRNDGGMLAAIDAAKQALTDHAAATPKALPPAGGTAPA